MKKQFIPIRIISFFIICWIPSVLCKNRLHALEELITRLSQDPFYQLTAYKPNYILPYHGIFGDVKPLKQRPVTVGRLPSNYEVSEKNPIHENMKKTEAMFQLSGLLPLFRFQLTNTRFYLTYTQKSYWQCYTGVSAAFRAQDHIPELVMEQPLSSLKERLYVEKVKIALIHHSNGVGYGYERTWDRLYIEGIFHWKQYFISLKPWYVLPTKSMKKYNPYVRGYLGDGEVKIGFRYYTSQLNVRMRLGSTSFTESSENGESILKKMPIIRFVEVVFMQKLSPALQIYVRLFQGIGSTIGMLKEKSVTTFGIGIASCV